MEKATIKGYNVFDFQADVLTMNLDNYKDTTHYKQDINDWMIECFAKLKYKADVKSIDEYEKLLRNNVEKFKLKIEY